MKADLAGTRTDLDLAGRLVAPAEDEEDSEDPVTVSRLGASLK